MGGWCEVTEAGELVCRCNDPDEASRAAVEREREDSRELEALRELRAVILRRAVGDLEILRLANRARRAG